MNDLSSRTDEGPQHMATGLRSPPLPSASQTPKRFDPGNRQEGAILKSPKMPQMGLFSASPGPRSPIKRPPLWAGINCVHCMAWCFCDMSVCARALAESVSLFNCTMEAMSHFICV